MSTVLPSAGTLEIIANAATQDAAASDVFSVSADGEYDFSFARNGAFTALQFALVRFSGYSQITILTIDATFITALTLALSAGISYQLICQSFVGGTDISVSATGPNAPGPTPPTEVDADVTLASPVPLPITVNLPVTITVAGPEPGDPGFPMIVTGL